MEFWKLPLQWSAPDPAHVGGTLAGAVHRIVLAAQVVWDALFAFVTEEALIRASSLAFTTVLALVPLITVGLRVMNFYGVSESTRQEFESVLAQYPLPAQSRDVANLMLEAASQVTQNIGALGLAGFCVTLVLLARELEGHIQKICGAKGSLTTSLLHYCAFLVLAPTGALLAFGLLHPLSALLALLPGDLSRINYPFALTSSCWSSRCGPSPATRSAGAPAPSARWPRASPPGVPGKAAPCISAIRCRCRPTARWPPSRRSCCGCSWRGAACCSACRWRRRRSRCAASGRAAQAASAPMVAK